MPNLSAGAAAHDDAHAAYRTPADGDDDGGFDVNKLDSSALQDVIQYSGVDLKAEAEMILRGSDAFLSSSLSAAPTAPVGKDPRVSFDYFCNGARLKALVSTAVLARGVADMNEDCLDMIALAVQRRLSQVVADLAAISRHRVDYGRARFKIKIDNDPKRQLWLVDQYLQIENEKVKVGQGSLGSADSLAVARAKLRRAEKKSGEDVVVKTKLANVTAAVATGLQLKSWMTDASALAAAPLSDPSSAPAAAGGAAGAAPDAGGASSKLPLHFAQVPSATPVSDRELQTQFATRTVTIKDLLYYAEHDPHLRHSTFLLSLYHQLAA